MQSGKAAGGSSGPLLMSTEPRPSGCGSAWYLPAKTETRTSEAISVLHRPSLSGVASRDGFLRSRLGSTRRHGALTGSGSVAVGEPHWRGGGSCSRHFLLRGFDLVNVRPGP